MNFYRIQPIILLLIASIAFTGVACADDGNTTNETNVSEWTHKGNYTLYWGDTIKVSGYDIQVEDFSKASEFSDIKHVVISVKNSTTSWRSILSVNNTTIQPKVDYNNNTASEVFNGSLKINSFDIVNNESVSTPYTKIGVYKAKNPEELKTFRKINKTWINTTLEVKKWGGKDVYINERARITLQIENLKDIDFENIEINESLPNHFVVDPDKNVNISMDLDGKSTKQFSYHIKSLKAGEFKLPPTHIALTHLGITYHKNITEYEPIHNNTTKPSWITVHGPKLNITKTIDATKDLKVDDVVNITVDVHNTGDRSATVNIEDRLPAKAELIEGNIKDSLILHPSQKRTLDYSIKMKDKGNVIVPAASAEFIDQKRYSDTVRTERFMLNVGDVPVQKSDELESIGGKTKNTTNTSDSKVKEQNQTEKGIFEQIKSLPNNAYNQMKSIGDRINEFISSFI
ncbi:BatD family protein [Methanohalobium sp.]|uniref:BatD family protein n=1 Tax=Methanohalobium sp. TaxID=2837493 RepID=UPI0025F9066A|nr:BatD family protein [Methanohalobium sp.]